MRLASLFLLCAISTLFCLSCGAVEYMSLTGTPLTFPVGVLGGFEDVYADQSKDVFLVLSNYNPPGPEPNRVILYQLNYARTLIVAETNISVGCCSGPNRLYTTLADTQGFVYFLDDNIALNRFVVDDIKNHTIMGLSGDFIDSTTIAFNPADNRAYAVSPFTPHVVVFDAVTMTILTRFNYSQGDIRMSDPDRPGGWAPVIDSRRNYLYIGVQCSIPTQGVVWQYDIFNPFAPVLRNYRIWGSNPCFSSGFVDEVTGRLWYYETNAGWVGGFDKDDLSYGSDYIISTNTEVRRFIYDSNRNQALWFDDGRDLFTTGTYTGSIYRMCTLEESPASLHETQEWEPLGAVSDVRNVHWESANNLLFVLNDANAVYNVFVNGTDCPQPLASSADSLSSVWLSFLHLMF